MSTGIFNVVNSVFFVGGTGTKAGVANPGGYHGPSFDPSVDISTIMGANGAPFFTTAVAAFTQSGTFLDATGIGIGTGGMVAYVSDGGVNITTDRHSIVIISDDRILCPSIVSTGDATGVTVNIGGAFQDLETAHDETDASSYTVKIYTNKDETLTGELTLDLTGSSTNGTAKIIEGFNTTVGDMRRGQTYEGTYVTYDADGGAYNGFGVDFLEANLELRHLRVTNTAGASGQNGFDLNCGIAASTAIRFIDCKADDCYNGFNISAAQGRGCLLLGCIATNNANDGFYLSNAPQTVIDACLSYENVNANFSIIGTTSVLKNCTAWSTTGNYANFYFTGSGCTFVNCSSYKAAYGFRQGGSGVAYLYNCIADSATVADVYNDGGMLFGDYNCFSSLTGVKGYNRRKNVFSATVDLGGNDIVADPQFVDPANGDLTSLNVAVLRGGRPDIEGNIAPMGAILVPQHFSGGSRAFGPGRVSIIKN